MRKYYIFISALTVFVIIIVISGIIQSGGPISAKDIKLDEERLNNFREISYEIDDYFTTEGKLPKNLETLSENSSTKKLIIKDPQSKKTYIFQPKTQYTYELCTNFSTDSKDISKRFESYDYYDDYGNNKKTHPKGYACMEYEVDSYAIEDYDYSEKKTNSINVFSQADNTKRKSDITQILNAIGAYAADNKGALPKSITLNSQEISDLGADLCVDLVPNYIPALPQDPSIDTGTDINDCEDIYDTGYDVMKDANDRVTVLAPLAEGDQEISISR